MVKLRALGLTLTEARGVADEAARGVIYAALANHRDAALAVDGSAEEAGGYIRMLEEKTGDGYLLVLADLPDLSQMYRHAVIENGKCVLVNALSEDVLDETTEVAGLANLWAIASAMAAAVPRPLFTLIMPKDFRHN